MSKQTSKQQICSILNQLQENTNLTIKDVEFGNTYFVFESKEQDTICHFHIKEIPGFKFAIWNINRFDTLEYQKKHNITLWSDFYRIDSTSKFIFFTQYKKYIDKFKPSQSSFVTGITGFDYRRSKNTFKWNLDDIEDILIFMKKHPIKAAYYVPHRIEMIWDQSSDIKILYSYIKDNIEYYYNELKKKFEIHRLHFKCKRLLKSLKYFNALLIDKACWSPRMHIELRYKDNIEIDSRKYEKEYAKIYNFVNKNYMKVTCNFWQGESSDGDEKSDLKFKKSFRDLVVRYKYNIDIDEDEKLIFKNF